MHQDRASPRGFIREIILSASGQEKADEDRWQNGGISFQREGFLFFKLCCNVTVFLEKI